MERTKLLKADPSPYDSSHSNRNLRTPNNETDEGQEHVSSDRIDDVYQDSADLEIADIEVEETIGNLQRMNQVDSVPALQIFCGGRTMSGNINASRGGEQNDGVFLEFLRNDILARNLKDEEGKLKYLKYGDKIKLRLKSKEELFYLHSDGYATQRIYFHHGNSPSGVTEIFRVVPKGEYARLNELRRELKRIMKEKNKGKSSNNDLIEKELSYRKEILEEIEANKNLYKDLEGKPVKYKEKIQLVNEETQQYMIVSENVEMSKTSLDAVTHKAKTELKMLIDSGIETDIMRIYSLRLSPYTCASTHFSFCPCYDYQEMGYILEEDYFYLAYEDIKLLGKSFHLYFPHIDPLVEQHDTFSSYNAYMYESVKMPLKYEGVDEAFLSDHLFSSLHRKCIWITHIEAPLFLCLEKIEKSTEQEEEELGDMIFRGEEVLSQPFKLEFKKIDSESAISSNGLWIVTAGKEDNRKVFLKHYLYDVWLQPLIVEKVVRGKNEKGIIIDGSVFKMKKQGSNEFINIKKSVSKWAAAGSNSVVLTEDYASCFKVIQAKDHEKLRYMVLADLNRFIRVYDEQALRKNYDFTEKCAYRMLSRVLKRLKRLCLNTLPITCDLSLQCKVPSEEIQRVSYYLLINV